MGSGWEWVARWCSAIPRSEAVSRCHCQRVGLFVERMTIVAPDPLPLVERPPVLDAQIVPLPLLQPMLATSGQPGRSGRVVLGGQVGWLAGAGVCR